jgi:hypothetical protein
MTFASPTASVRLLTATSRTNWAASGFVLESWFSSIWISG